MMCLRTHLWQLYGRWQQFCHSMQVSYGVMPAKLGTNVTGASSSYIQVPMAATLSCCNLVVQDCC